MVKVVAQVALSPFINRPRTPKPNLLKLSLHITRGGLA
jgi:hypothetical protein